MLCHAEVVGDLAFGSRRLKVGTRELGRPGADEYGAKGGNPERPVKKPGRDLDPSNERHDRRLQQDEQRSEEQSAPAITLTLAAPALAIFSETSARSNLSSVCMSADPFCEQDGEL